ncbi:hypothetical protein FOA52_000254 [Chlamydomonas sp. UWO 241]|nr:hypothetical protein FOA52_000254 [Chlamydomonas sp. UWO 241]
MREMLTEARACYRRRGGCPPLAAQQSLTLGRFLIGLYGSGDPVVTREVAQLAGAAADACAHLLAVDRMACAAAAAQLLGAAGHLRRRALLLWHCGGLARTAGDAPGALRLALLAVDPPAERATNRQLKLCEDAPPGDGDHRGDSDAAAATDGPRGVGAANGSGGERASVSWALQPTLQGGGAHGSAAAFRGAGWPSVQVAALETLRVAAAGAGDAANAWHACASTLRHHHSGLSATAQAGLLDAAARAAAALPPSQRARPGLGPPVALAQLASVPVLPAALQPAEVSAPVPVSGTSAGADGGGGGGNGNGNDGNGGGSGDGRNGDDGPSGNSPFIFDPNAAKRRERSALNNTSNANNAAAAAAAAGNSSNSANGSGGAPPPEPRCVAEWVVGEESTVEVVLRNPLSFAVAIDSLVLTAEFTPDGVNGAGGVNTSTPAGSTTSGPTATADGGVSGSGSSSSGGVIGFWLPVFVSLTLPPGGSPVPLSLVATPLMAGLIRLTGLSVSALGASWHEPFGAHSVALSSCLSAAPRAGRSRKGGGEGGAGTASTPAADTVIRVTPGLPLLRCVITRAGGRRRLAAEPPWAQLRRVAPRDALAAAAGAGAHPAGEAGEAGAAPSASGETPAGATPGGGDGGAGGGEAGGGREREGARSLSAWLGGGGEGGGGGASRPGARPLPVWRGQRDAWALSLTNVGATPVAAVSASLTNHRGAALKALPAGCWGWDGVETGVGGLGGVDGASHPPPGAHLRFAPGALAALQAALPIAPGATVHVPLQLTVGAAGPATSQQQRSVLAAGWLGGVGGAPSGEGGGGGGGGASGAPPIELRVEYSGPHATASAAAGAAAGIAPAGGVAVTSAAAGTAAVGAAAAGVAVASAEGDDPPAGDNDVDAAAAAVGASAGGGGDGSAAAGGGVEAAAATPGGAPAPGCGAAGSSGAGAVAVVRGRRLRLPLAFDVRATARVAALALAECSSPRAERGQDPPSPPAPAAGGKVEAGLLALPAAGGRASLARSPTLGQWGSELPTPTQAAVMPGPVVNTELPGASAVGLTRGAALQAVAVSGCERPLRVWLTRVDAHAASSSPSSAAGADAADACGAGGGGGGGGGAGGARAAAQDVLIEPGDAAHVCCLLPSGGGGAACPSRLPQQQQQQGGGTHTAAAAAVAALGAQWALAWECADSGDGGDVDACGGSDGDGGRANGGTPLPPPGEHGQADPRVAVPYPPLRGLLPLPLPELSHAVARSGAGGGVRDGGGALALELRAVYPNSGAAAPSAVDAACGERGAGGAGGGGVGGGSDGACARVADVTQLAERLGLRPLALPGSLWAVSLRVGQLVEVELVAAAACDERADGAVAVVGVSLVGVNLAAVAEWAAAYNMPAAAAAWDEPAAWLGAAGAAGGGALPPSVGAGLASGLLLLGQTEGVGVALGGAHRVCALATQPGLYQLRVCPDAGSGPYVAQHLLLNCT